jgi:hypothetical protein
LSTNIFADFRELFKTKFEALISPETFDKAQEITSSNSNNPKKYVAGEAPNLLQGVINCDLCEGAMTPTYTTKKSTGKQYYYYICSKKKGGRLPKHITPKTSHIKR